MWRQLALAMWLAGSSLSCALLLPSIASLRMGAWRAAKGSSLVRFASNLPREKFLKRKERRLQTATEEHMHERDDDEKFPLVGMVIERLGDRLTVRQSNTDGVTTTADPVFHCTQRSHLSKVSIVPGDRVRFAPNEFDPTQGIVNSLFPRLNLLERPAAATGDLRKRTAFKAICSNIDQLVVVLASQPYVPLHTVDRFLVTARLSSIPRVLMVINKSDLPEAEQLSKLVANYYAGLQVRVVHSSTTSAEGLQELCGALQGLTSILVGQSGVGKSSIVNALLPASNVRVGPLSKDCNFGSHTTSNARLYHLDSGGAIIDSPGMREMAVWHYSPAQIAQGFEDIATEATHCRFRDCRHEHEGEACAVLRAVAEGRISPQRLQSFRNMVKATA